MQKQKRTDFLNELFNIIDNQAKKGNKKSYTKSLIKEGKKKDSPKSGRGDY